MKTLFLVWFVTWDLTQQVTIPCPELNSEWGIKSDYSESIFCFHDSTEHKESEFRTKEDAEKFMKSKPNDTNLFKISNVRIMDEIEHRIYEEKKAKEME